MKLSRQYLRRLLRKVHVIDKCLILFMFLLLIESACNVFIARDLTPDMTNIDAITRTTAASIFGYFLSANFVKRHAYKGDDSGACDAPDVPACDASDIDADTPQNRIGFISDDAVPQTPSLARTPQYGASRPQRDEPREYTNCIQIIIATCIGLSSLVLLLYLRNFGSFVPDSENTLYELHYFLSGCVGFLIGCPTNTVEDA